MKLLQLVTLLTLVAVIFGQRSYAEFEIRKRSTSGDKSVAVGKLSLNFVQAYNSIEPSVRSYMDELITEDDFGGNHQAILEFVCIETDLPEYKDRVYMTSVDELSSEPHGQKIAIILGPHTESSSINSINYVQVASSSDLDERPSVGDLHVGGADQSEGGSLVQV